MSLTLTDIFAGAGGSSTGAVSVPGVEVRIAANHWRLAVDVHNANHPSTEHACVDLHHEDPRNFPATDILWASPECTKWSQASGKNRALSEAMGGDPSLFDDIPDELVTTEQDEIDRSRLLMFDVLRFVEHHRYRAVIVENVVDIATQAKFARAWELWRRGLHRLGYAFRVVSLNSMHAQTHGLPAPQSRDRLYVVAWPQSEQAPDLERALSPKAWCDRCEQVVESRQAWKNGRTVGRYRAQYVYVCRHCGRVVEPGWLPASAAIDWSLRGQLIGERTKPLSEKTMARIREGLRRYGTAIVEAGGNQYDAHDPKHPQYGVDGAYSRSWPVTDPLRTLHTSPTKALVSSLLVPVEGRDGKDAMPDHVPMRTQTTRNELGIVTTLRGLLVPYYSASETAKPTTQPVGTLTTRDRYALVEGQPIDPDDCTFRMLEPHEIAAGMAFPADYIWAGSKRERVRMQGNAVTPPAARDLIAAVVASIDRSAA